MPRFVKNCGNWNTKSVSSSDRKDEEITVVNTHFDPVRSVSNVSLFEPFRPRFVLLRVPTRASERRIDRQTIEMDDVELGSLIDERLLA